MEIIWILVGVGVAWFIFSFRATKARVRKVAGVEVAQFMLAVDAWNANRDDLNGQLRAMHHFIVYDTRRADFVSDPTGRLVPADRALLASFWVQHLTDVRLLTPNGQQSRWRADAALFWDSIATLRAERDLLLAQSHFS